MWQALFDFFFDICSLDREVKAINFLASCIVYFPVWHMMFTTAYEVAFDVQINFNLVYTFFFFPFVVIRAVVYRASIGCHAIFPKEYVCLRAFSLAPFIYE